MPGEGEEAYRVSGLVKPKSRCWVQVRAVQVREVQVREVRLGWSGGAVCREWWCRGNTLTFHPKPAYR